MVRYYILLPLLMAAGTAYGDRVFDPYTRVFDPYVGVVVQNDSNLFAVPSEAPVNDPHGVPRFSDTVATFKAGFDFNYLFDRQRLYATVEGRKVEYEHFTDLNHSEYLVNLGLAWKLTSR